MDCLECGTAFEARKAGRPQKFCSRECFSKNYYRHPHDTGAEDRNRNCEVCQVPFVQKKRHQRYCSTECYKKAWPLLNREIHNAKSVARRAANPEWYAAREPGYTKVYRSKLLSKHPWAYLLKSRQADARERGLEFTLTQEWAAARWNNRCEITGILFRVNGKRGPHPFSPSIDRIDTNEGYTPGNSRFILWGCNALKGVGTDADMYEIARAIAAAYP